MAGLPGQIEIVEEPKAALMAFGIHSKQSETVNHVVIKCGGSKLEATFVQANQQGLTIKQSQVSEQCGGFNFDEVLAEHYMNRVMCNSNQKEEERAFIKMDLRQKCRLAKHELSFKDKTIVSGSWYQGKYTLAESELTRKVFEKKVQHVLLRCM